MESNKGKYSSPDGSAMWEYFSVMSCASLLFCSGCISGWNSPTLGKLRDPGSSMPLTSSEESTLTSVMSLGTVLAPLLMIVMADKLGRQKSLLVSGVPSMISWVMIATSKNTVVFFVARFIAGIAYSLNICIVPMYLGEIASANSRGTMGTLCSLMYNAGLLFMFAMVPYLSVPTAACVCLSIATASTISAWLIPESPYFLGMAGRFDEAEGALEKLRGKTDVGEELELIKKTVRQKDDSELNEEGLNREAPKNPSALKQLVMVRGNRKALGIMLFFYSALYLGSFFIVVVYGDIIFIKMDAGLEPQLCTLIIGVIQLVSNLLVAFIIDKVGRRPLILTSGLVSGLCVLIVGVFFHLMEHTDIDMKPYSLWALSVMFLNMIALNIGLMPLAMVMLAEIFSTEVKPLAITLIRVVSGIFSAISTKCYLMVAETWGYGHAPPFFAFVVITWFATAMILKLLPETKGKTLLEIQRDLNA